MGGGGAFRARPRRMCLETNHPLVHNNAIVDADSVHFEGLHTLKCRAAGRWALLTLPPRGDSHALAACVGVAREQAMRSSTSRGFTHLRHGAVQTGGHLGRRVRPRLGLLTLYTLCNHRGAAWRWCDGGEFGVAILHFGDWRAGGHGRRVSRAANTRRARVARQGGKSVAACHRWGRSSTP